MAPCFSILPLPLLLIVRTPCYPVELVLATPQLHRPHPPCPRSPRCFLVRGHQRCSVAPPPLDGLPTATLPPLRARGDKVERERESEWGALGLQACQLRIGVCVFNVFGSSVWLVHKTEVEANSRSYQMSKLKSKLKLKKLTFRFGSTRFGSVFS